MPETLQDDPFASPRFNDAKPPTGDGVFLQPGRYNELEIVKCKQIVSRKGKKFFVVELVVNKSAVASIPDGTMATWMVDFASDFAMQDIRNFVAQCLKVPFEQTTPTACKGTTSAANPLQGTKLACTVVAKPLKSGPPGGTFSKHIWTCLKVAPAMEAANAAA